MTNGGTCFCVSLLPETGKPLFSGRSTVTRTNQAVLLALFRLQTGQTVSHESERTKVANKRRQAWTGTLITG